MGLIDRLNERFDHPNTLIFDEGALTIIGMMLGFLALGIIGLIYFWPLAVIGFITFAVLGVIAWKDFGRFLIEAMKRG